MNKDMRLQSKALVRTLCSLNSRCLTDGTAFFFLSSC